MRNTFGRFRFGLLIGALMILNASVEAGTACVWRVTSVKHPFYLVGSSHALENRDFALAAPYQEALNVSQRFVFEFNLSQAPQFAKQFETAAKYPKGQD